MNKVTAVFGHGLVKAVGFVGVVAAVLVGGVPSDTVNSALAAPQVGTIPVAPKKPVTLPVTPKVIELPKLTISESENEVTFDIREIQGMLKSGETLETELLTKDKKSYAGALADFYALADKLCHVATLSPDMALAQQCSPTTKSRGLQEWGSAITYLSGIAQGVRPDMRSALSYAAFVRRNPGAVYLIVKGRSVIAAAVKDLQGVMNGTVRMANALPIEFDGCNLPQKASGDQLSKVCLAALPVPPLMGSIKDGKLVLNPQTKGEALVFVQINTRLAKATKANPVANLPVELKPLFRPPFEGCSPDGKGEYCGCHVMYAPVGPDGEVLQVARYAKLPKERVSEADCKGGKVTVEGVGKHKVFTATPHYLRAESKSSSSSSSVSSSSKSSSSSSSVSSSSKSSSSSSSSITSSVSSSSKTSSSSTDTTSTTEETTTTTEVNPSSGFVAECGRTNDLTRMYRGPDIEKIYVGTICLPKLVEPGGSCYGSPSGQCEPESLKKAECKSFCDSFKERHAKWRQEVEAVERNCRGLIRKNNQSHPAEVGQCPGKCPLEGTKGCVNSNGPGHYSLGRPGYSSKFLWPEGRTADDWNLCDNYFCAIQNNSNIHYNWTCTGCELDPASLSSESSSSSSSEAPSTTVEETSTTVRETSTTVEQTTTTSEVSSSSSVSSSSNSSSSSSTLSVSSSSKSSSSSTDTTSTTEETTTTTEVNPSSGFVAECGQLNAVESKYRGPEIEPIYVGTVCNPKVTKPGCHDGGQCDPEKAGCKSYCDSYKERMAKFRQDREAALRNCRDLVQKNNQNHPAEVGQCPGKCRLEGTKGCVNANGPGHYSVNNPPFWSPVMSEDRTHDDWNLCDNIYCRIPNNAIIHYTWTCTGCELDPASLSSDSSSSSSSEAPSTTVEETSTTVRETTTTVEETSTSVVETTTTSDDSSSSYSSSSASEKIYACMCDGKDGAGRVVRSESSPSTQSECGSFCPASQRDKDGWCTKTDGFGTKFKVRNCKWELTDPPLN